MPASTIWHSKTGRFSSLLWASAGGTTTTPGDVTPPVISAISAASVPPSAAIVTWTTDELATSSVKYWITTAGEGTALTTTPNAALITSHNVSLTGLTAATGYSYKVISVDQAGNSATSSANTFTSASTSTLSGFDVSTLTLATTFNSIDIEILVDSGSLTNSSDGRQNMFLESATLRFKKTADSTWRAGLELWGVNANLYNITGAYYDVGYAFYGSVLLCTEGTGYDIEVTVTDKNGAVKVLTGSITTRAESSINTLAQAQALTATRFVSPSGNDSNAGTSVGVPWKTLNKAMSTAPSGAVVAVAAGRYVPAATARAFASGPITFVGPSAGTGVPVSYSAGVWTINPNTGSAQAIVEPVTNTLPSTGAWTATEAGTPLIGPGLGGAPAGVHYPAWLWTNVNADGTTSTAATRAQIATMALAPAADRDGAMLNIPKWKKDPSSGATAYVSTAAGWAEFLNTNQTWDDRPYGFWVDGSGNVYAILPNGGDPNDYYVVMNTGANSSTSYALRFSAVDCAVYGLHFRGCYYAAGATTSGSRMTIDHCLFRNSKYPVNNTGTQGTAASGMRNAQYAADHTVQYCVFTNSSTWKYPQDDANAPSVPWSIIKNTPHAANGAAYSAGNKMCGELESTCVYGIGGAKRVVTRYCLSDNMFNGFGRGQQSQYDRYAGAANDLHDCKIVGCGDDAVEPDSQCINFRSWNNRIEDSATSLSTAPGIFGPSYFWRNAAWRIGNHGLKLAGDGTGVAVGSSHCKYSGNAVPPAKQHFMHNTFWDVTGLGGAGVTVTHGAAKHASGSRQCELFWMRNNIYRVSGYTFDSAGYHLYYNVSGKATQNGLTAQIDEDYNIFVTDKPRDALSSSSTGFQADIKYNSDITTGAASLAAYRTQFGRGAHTNHWGGVDHTFIDYAAVDALLTDPSNGDLTLKAGSAAINGGTPVANISDRAGVDYLGAAPDLGYAEKA